TSSSATPEFTVHPSISFHRYFPHPTPHPTSTTERRKVAPDVFGFWRNFSREGRLDLFSTSPYAAITASHTCRIMAPGLVVSDVSNCPFLILFASSIPLNVTFAFPNLLNHSIW